MIRSIETIPVDVSTIRPHKLSVATMHTQTLVLVRVRCEDGIEGWGEATTVGGFNYGGESLESIKVNIDAYIVPLLIGMEARNVTAAMAHVCKTIQGNRFVKYALETALLDAQAHRLGVPLSELLGGWLHDALPVAWTFASGDTKKDIAKAEAILAKRRHCTFRLKIGLRPIADGVAYVLAIKRALGDAMSVRVDVNQAWSKLDAANGIAALQAGGIGLVEQPVRAENRAVLERLARQFVVPMMVDKALHDPLDAFELAYSANADVFATKIAQSGGLVPAMQVAAIVQFAGISPYGGTMLGEAVDTAASAYVFSTFGELQFSTELFSPLLFTQELLTEPLQYHDFMSQVPTGPGLGIEIDRDKLARLCRQ